MRIHRKRLNDVPERKEGSFKPWLGYKEANKVAQRLKKKGCHVCGTNSSPALISGPDGKVFKGEYWYPFQNLGTGEEWLVCAPCHQKILIQKECLQDE